MIKIQTNFTGLRSLRTAVKIPKCSVNFLKEKAAVTAADLTKKRRRKADETGADNPQNISFECDRSVAEMKSPFGESSVQDMGRKNMKISGSGQLYGEDCAEQFERLFEVFRNSGKEVLSVPNLPSIYAVFEKLEIKGEPKPNVLEYSFVFREVMEKKQKTVITYFDCENGQTLWDIAYKTGVKIDELVRLNPDVKFPDENLGTRRVKLC